MTNKEIFTLSTQVARNLKAQGQVPAVAPCKQSVYDTISPTLQKLTNTPIEQDNKKEDGLNPSPDLSDSQLRTRLKNLLIVKLDNGTVTAAEIAQLKDVFGLADATSDLTIEIVNYKDACPECARREKPEQCPGDAPADALTES